MSVSVPMENIKTYGEVDFMEEFAQELVQGDFQQGNIEPEVKSFHEQRGIDMRVVAKCEGCDLVGKEITYDMAISLEFDDPAVAAEFAAQFGSGQEYEA